MVKHALIVGLLSIACGSFTAHEYFVTITEAEYNLDNNSVEVSIKFIGHDLEYALEQQGMEDLFLGTEYEVEQADEYLMNYISDRFRFTVDGEELDFAFIGKEVTNEDFIYCYIEAMDVDEFSELTIKNTLLTEQFDQQSNIVYFKKGEQSLSLTLRKDHKEETHTIS